MNPSLLAFLRNQRNNVYRILYPKSYESSTKNHLKSYTFEDQAKGRKYNKQHTKKLYVKKSNPGENS